MIQVDLDNIINGKNKATNFGSHLLRLIFKADSENRDKLRRIYPAAVRAVQHYKDTGEITDGG